MKAKILQASALLVTGAVVLALSASAHDTNTTHPQMSDAAGLAIKSQDGVDGAYAEFYYRGPPPTSVLARVYWGENIQLAEPEARPGKLDAFNRRPLNVIDGSVMEDFPDTRVFSHFYHGYSGNTLFFAGAPIFAGAPSAFEGFRYFDQAVEVFDSLDAGLTSQGADGSSAFADSGKSLGYWLLGHSLHHVEDMASIAHVHNDSHMPQTPTLGIPHLPTYDLNSMDVFEAQYVPTLLWGAAGNGLYGPLGIRMLNDMKNAVPVNVQNLDAVWGPPRPEHVMMLDGQGTLFGDSLTRATYNLSVFQGALDRPFWFPTNPPSVAECPKGELAEMLNGTGPAACGPNQALYHLGLNFWSIQGVGKWYYSWVDIRDAAFIDSWWAVSPGYQSSPAFVGPAVLPSQHTVLPNGQTDTGSYFYIEDLAYNQHRGQDLVPGDLFVPAGIRQNYSKPWDRSSNPVVPNTLNVPIAEFIASRIVPYGTAYVAGVAKLWYDVANPPPYLKRVIVRQNGELIYDGTWQDVKGVRNITLTTKAGLTEDAVRPFAYVKRRELARISTGKFINPHEPFELELEFSEPVQSPDENGNSDKFEIYLGDDKLNHSVYTVVDMRANDAQAWPRKRQFVVTVNGPLPNLWNKEGRVKLGVRAFDRNNHFVYHAPSKYGAVVDADPSTPAHRQRVHADRPRAPYLWERDQWLDYFWHTSDSIDVNYPDVPRGGFAYDEAPGRDESHYLLFDGHYATATVTVYEQEVP